VLAKIIEDAIVERLDMDAFAEVLKQEELDRVELLALPPGAGA
jgi:hypothetical protein